MEWWKAPKRKRPYSYSSVDTFMSCPRKWAYRYVDEIVPVELDMQALDRGKAFHALNEGDEMGSLAVGLNDFDRIKVDEAFKVYRATPGIPNLSVKEWRLEDPEADYIGYVDEAGAIGGGLWQLGELKTTKAFQPLKFGTLEIEPQIALYTHFAKKLGRAQGFEPEGFAGVSYRVVEFTRKEPLKANKRRADAETPEEYRERITGDARVYHRVVHPSAEATRSALQTFESVKAAGEQIRRYGSACAPKNPSNCRAYQRPCEFFNHCWGIAPAADMPDMVVDDLDDI